MPNTYQKRLNRIERENGDQCDDGCAKCALVQVSAATVELQWGSCNQEPMGLLAILRGINQTERA